MASPQPTQAQELTYTWPQDTAAPTPPPPSMPPAPPNISRRTYIYFLPHPLPAGTPVPYTPNLPAQNPLNLPPHAFEPTSTLVLTSPHSTFVDVRYLKPIEGKKSTASAEQDLDWAFAGSSASEPAAQEHPVYGAYTRNRWTHWVDSRYPRSLAKTGTEEGEVEVETTIPPDEGAMYTLAPGRYLEHGHAFHPHLGRVAGHEEAWEDVQVDAVPLSASTPTLPAQRVCIVLRCHDDARGLRGVVVRVGQFVQGIVQGGGMVATERWEWREEGDGERSDLEKGDREQSDQEKGDREEQSYLGQEGREKGEGGWKRTGRTGEWFLPCAVTWQVDRVVVGGRVRYGEFEWVVEERWVWE